PFFCARTPSFFAVQRWAEDVGETLSWLASFYFLGNGRLPVVMSVVIVPEIVTSHRPYFPLLVGAASSGSGGGAAFTIRYEPVTPGKAAFEAGFSAAASGPARSSAAASKARYGVRQAIIDRTYPRPRAVSRSLSSGLTRKRHAFDEDQVSGERLVA